MAKKRKKVPTLRRGLTVDELLAGTWMISPDRYIKDDELVELVDKMVRDTCQALIDEADAGEEINRRAVINTFCSIGQMLVTCKDHITQKMSNGEFIPTILDKIANA